MSTIQANEGRQANEGGFFSLNPRFYFHAYLLGTRVVMYLLPGGTGAKAAVQATGPKTALTSTKLDSLSL
jgi:hypothetical protein